MNSTEINLLDCTLRDGGYINNWEFSDFNIIRIIQSLVDAGAEIIECGYISEKKGRKGNHTTLFKSIDQINVVLEKINVPEDRLFVAMVNYGEADLTSFPLPSHVKGIRIAFHKKDCYEAIKASEALIQKGYKVFIQPMVTLCYTDEEIIQAIKRVNSIGAYAYYIVDSFGAMRGEDVIRLSSLINHNLSKEIRLGFHAHNNLQLAFSNAINFLENVHHRSVIIDCSIFGMGRGAGNLTTELFANHLNEYKSKNYRIEPILEIIDSVISNIFRKKTWGYSMSYYLSAIHNCHPNYATFLVNKKSLPIPDIQRVLKEIHPDKKIQYDEKYIEELYTKLNSSSHNESNEDIKINVDGNQILVVVPGRSIGENLQQIIHEMENKVTISVNHAINEIDADYYFFSNQKRYNEFIFKRLTGSLRKNKFKIIHTSNVKTDPKFDDETYMIEYSKVLGITDKEKDNSVVMLLNFLSSLEPKEIYIAGFDGYDEQQSYFSEDMEISLPKKLIEEKNNLISKEINEIRKKLDLIAVTKSRFL